MITKLHSCILFLCVLLIFSACQKEFTIKDINTGGTSAGTAEFKFAGAPGNCYNPTISGLFQAGTALSITNLITVDVNVTIPGTYTISSNSANGFIFSTSGLFISTGQQTIVFIATGTPAAAGSFNYTLGTSGCTFSITCSGGTSSNTDCKDCIYVPLCVGSKYSYYDTTGGAAIIKNSDFLSSVDTTIDSKIYKKISVSSGNAYYNCTNGETNVIGYQLISNNGNALQKVQFTMIKANAAVGTTWLDNLTNSLGQTVIQKFKIEGKGISKTLGSNNFTDIIVVSLETGIDIQPFGYIPGTLTNYFYAKGVGLVEITTQDLNSGLIIYHSVIKSYFIP